ncbi:methyltransferase domain-containing protein [Streptomyces exfoliatus]|uniref:methyltransferase domain-containing protein n=1 Tax=Streptomyces exfoliatus TaxID=1905 RepID=UPI000A552213|nr:methyltransferase domain-containing protein [Streptomyces exfoliatus]
MTDFASVGDAYAAHSRSARGRLRHDLVARRLLAELPDRPARILDVGCGNGEMTLRLAAAGHHVTAVDPSADMLEAAARRLDAHPELRPLVRFREAGIATLPGGEQYDAVCCHGVLMYLDDSADAVARLSRLLAPGGLLSLLTKNRAAIGVREALRGDYAAARDLIAHAADTSLGHLGLPTRGDTAELLDGLARDHGLVPLSWQGIRIFHEHLTDAWAPGEEEYEAALRTEWTASWIGPYRDMGRQVHTLARRDPAGPAGRTGLSGGGRHAVPMDVHLIAVRDGERGPDVLLSRRAGAVYAAGHWHFPSGHVDGPFEDVVTALVREAREETGLVVDPDDVRAAVTVHHRSPAGGARVGFFFEVRRWAGTPRVMEPAVCDGMEWFALDALPEPMVAYCRAGLDAYRAGARVALHFQEPGDPIAHDPAVHRLRLLPGR